MAKLNRESKLRDKRVEKQARRAARKLAAATEPADATSRPEDPGATLPHPDADLSGNADPKSGAAGGSE
ncbi:MAG: hypothetical protein ACTHQQ_03895 [Solirubrobacteraceae bacterium]